MYRTDKNGYNLNRVYKNPDENLHPTIWGIKKYISYLSSIADIEYYIDFHGHANKFGYFTFGNHFFKYPLNNYGDDIESSNRFLFDFISQTNSYTFAKLCSLNNRHFSILNCDFSNKNMDLYKIGSGRVTMYREFGIMHAYTIEANYYCSKEAHEITTSEDVNCSSPIPINKNVYIKTYSINIMMSMGHGILSSILEMNYSNYCEKKWSRLATSPFRNIDNVTLWAIEQSEQLLNNTCGESISPTYKKLIKRLLSTSCNDELFNYIGLDNKIKQVKNKIENNYKNEVKNFNFIEKIEIKNLEENDDNETKKDTSLVNNKSSEFLRIKNDLHQIEYNKIYNNNKEKINQTCNDNDNKNINMYKNSSEYNSLSADNILDNETNKKIKPKMELFKYLKSNSNIKILSMSNILNDKIKKDSFNNNKMLRKSRSDKQNLNYSNNENNNNNNKIYNNKKYYSTNDLFKYEKKKKEKVNSIFNINKYVENNNNNNNSNNNNNNNNNNEKRLPIRQKYNEFLREHRQILKSSKKYSINNVFNNSMESLNSMNSNNESLTMKKKNSSNYKLKKKIKNQTKKKKVKNNSV
ncbi:hypothetical protein BCR32DRAFT_304417 [Anaeromyces robustus]|uniref:Peptidase M14 domain-containing protein n=1 Tax=Anaeromyces robustus TaxID=1754192 RepID=A0A1Y1WQZ0_9FUNG|nr:hypothetical protein BCR32DRAFT_304417 [Anaeromyces robustus]|eukprot:ORX75892.1 hypothetical protein BCR32DRAFT_304417 [Anaeromyces robustus]